MSNVITRAVNGSPLNITQMDANFVNLDNNKMEKAANLSDVANKITARFNIDAHRVYDRIVTTDSGQFTNPNSLFIGSSPASHFQIGASSIKGVFNFSMLAGWPQGTAHVVLPRLLDIPPQDLNSVLTISVSEINKEGGDIRVIPSNGDSSKISIPGNIFYPRGVITLRAGSSVSLVPDVDRNIWYVVALNDYRTIESSRVMELNLAASISSIGRISNARGTIPFSVTRDSTGQYRIIFSAVMGFGTPLAPIVSVTARTSSADTCVIPNHSAVYDSGAGKWTVKVFTNRVNTFYTGSGRQVQPIDADFDIIISCPTSNTSNLIIGSVSGNPSSVFGQI